MGFWRLINLFLECKYSLSSNKKKQIRISTMTTRNPTTLMTIPTEETFDFLFKIVLIGDCGTGKTCVVQRFKNGTFIEKHGNTIGVDFSMKTVMVDGKKVKVDRIAFVSAIISILMFLASNLGYGRSGKISHNHSELLPVGEWCDYRLWYYEKVVVPFCCQVPSKFSPKHNNSYSFNRWVEEVRRYSGSSVLLALVGNKADLESCREVEFDEAEGLSQYMPEVLFVLEASAKDNSNIEEAFMYLATELKVLYIDCVSRTEYSWIFYRDVRIMECWTRMMKRRWD